MLSIKKRVIFGILVAIFFCIGFTTFYLGTKEITKEFFIITSHDAQNIATIIAKDVELTDQDVSDLRKMSYREMFASKFNQKLTERVSNLDFHVPLKYVYLVAGVEDKDVRFKVDNKTTSFFSAPIGTPLNTMWLLDVPVKDAPPVSEDDPYRYYPMTPELSRILTDKKPTHADVLTDRAEWGESLRGYAPVFTKQGNFVGMLGVDLSAEDYEHHADKGFNIIWIVLIISNISLLSLMIFFYLRYLYFQERELYRDPLTNAYNRRFLDDFLVKKLKHDFSKQKPLALMMLDIDHFKRINDTYGHTRGDECLKAVTHAVYETLDNPPNLLIRYGGEEFLLGIAIDDEAASVILMTRILNAVRNLRLFRENDEEITISIGAVLCNAEEITPESINEFIKKADKNLYQAKDTGRDRFVFTNET